MTEVVHPLKKATLKVLEEWGLMLVDEVVETSCISFDEELPFYMSWVNLHGVVSGAVSIVAQKNFMQSLAANLLGVSVEETSEDDGKDAFKEMGNVLAGNFITEAYGEDVVFDLIDPNVNEIAQAEVEKFTQRNIVFTFLADDQPVAVTFSIKRGFPNAG